jgi:hypothetical protein
MKRYLIIGALLVSAITSSFAQSNMIDAFFHANPYLSFTAQAEYGNRSVGYVGYLLVNSTELAGIETNYLNQGCVRLGMASWKCLPYYGGGLPQKDEAIFYARRIGADLVLYTTYDEIGGTGYVCHDVYFYASKPVVRRAQPAQDSPDISSAERQLQAAWDRLPAAKKNALKASQRAWIQRKDAAADLAKLAMIKDRTAYLVDQ